ncbi:MAG: N-acetylneuraminate epimerase [Cardiobacteriaceae bacterium]|nr:N-acetylneuraminate epimerase [Cardiobacteriaceae bacterium]
MKTRTLTRIGTAAIISFYCANAMAQQHYPDLPQAVADGGGAIINDTAYAGLGSAGTAFFSLNLKTPEATWQALPDFPGGERSQPVVAAADGKLYVFGGLQKNVAGELQLVNDAYAYDPNTQQWQKLPTRSPLGLVGAQAFVYKNKIYVIGGSNLSIFNGYFQDYTAAGDDKNKQAAVMEAYFNQPAEDYFFNTTAFSYDPAQNRWHNEGQMPFSGRAGAAVSIKDGIVTVANGEIKPGLRTDAAAQAIFDSNDHLTWQTLPNLISEKKNEQQEGLAGAYAGYSGNYYLLAGGANFSGARARYESGKYYAHQGLDKVTHTTIYALQDKHWSIAGDLPQPAGYGITLNYDGKMILIGGKNNDGNLKRVLTLSYDGKALTIQ